MLASLIFAALLHFHLVTGQVPPQLVSPLIPQKVLATERSRPNVRWPQYTDQVGKWIWFDAGAWTSGFFPATHYALNTRRTLCGASPSTGLHLADWRALGISSSVGLPLDARSVGHDVGFISFPFVEELALNPNDQTARNSINALANALAGRFDSRVGCTRSWDTSDPTQFTVIIDNMMNLELLFVSASLTGNQALRNMAIRHADTTMQHHIRADGGSWHVVDYNSTSGTVIRKRTAQGYSDSSTWTRGQSWGIYGFANMHRLTGDVRYLETAKRMATYFLNSLPADGVVPWDFQAPRNPFLADSSASTLVSSALLLLAKQDTAATKYWTDAAIRILAANTPVVWKTSWASLLSNGTVHRPANNFNTGTVYGDYYFILAGNELISRGLASCTGTPAIAAGAKAPSEVTTSAAAVEVEQQSLTDSALGFDRSHLFIIVCLSLLSSFALHMF